MTVPSFLDLPEAVLDKLSPCPNTGCWHYAGKWHSGNGYGKIKYEGLSWMAHRLVYALMVGPVPDGHVLDHLCRNRWCCNPDHLEPVTVRINTRRGEAVLYGEDHAKGKA